MVKPCSRCVMTTVDPKQRDQEQRAVINLIHLPQEQIWGYALVRILFILIKVNLEKGRWWKSQNSSISSPLSHLSLSILVMLVNLQCLIDRGTLYNVLEHDALLHCIVLDISLQFLPLVRIIEPPGSEIRWLKCKRSDLT